MIAFSVQYLCTYVSLLVWDIFCHSEKFAQESVCLHKNCISTYVCTVRIVWHQCVCCARRNLFPRGKRMRGLSVTLAACFFPPRRLLLLVKPLGGGRAMQALQFGDYHWGRRQSYPIHMLSSIQECRACSPTQVLLKTCSSFIWRLYFQCFGWPVFLPTWRPEALLFTYCYAGWRMSAGCLVVHGWRRRSSCCSCFVRLESLLMECRAGGPVVQKQVLKGWGSVFHGVCNDRDVHSLWDWRPHGQYRTSCCS